MVGAKFCHRCGRAFGSSQAWCAGCGLERRRVWARPEPRARAPAGGEPFQWVWCHFFRNALVIGCVVFFLAAAVSHDGGWAVAMVVCVVLASIFHAYHAQVCLRRNPGRAAPRKTGGWND